LFVGLTTLDVVHVLDDLPGRDEKLTAREQFVAAGGPAANAAVTFAALGGRPMLHTVLGSHPVAAIALAELAERGVDVRDADPARSVALPVSAVRVEAATGLRSVSSADSAGPPPPMPAQFEDAEVLLVDGHWSTLAVAATRWARDRSVPVVVDAGRPRPVFAELFGHADLVVASSDFWPDPTEVALRAGADAVAVTDGPRPVRWATVDGSGTVEVPPVTAVDTAGAGDVFHGAVTYAVGRLGWPTAVALLPRVLAFAVAVAGVRVAHPGPRAWLLDPRLRGLAARWN
jgi:sugar/nucleoside kinase (ribokinase family)